MSSGFDDQNKFFLRAFAMSLVLHSALLTIHFDKVEEPKEEVKAEIPKVTLQPLTPEMIHKIAMVKKQVQTSPIKVEEKTKKPLPPVVKAGTQKIVKNATSLGDKNNTKEQVVQKGDPASKKRIAYKDGTELRKTKSTNIGSGGTPQNSASKNGGGGSGDTYKGLNFSAMSKSLFAKGSSGGRFKVRGGADDGGSGGGSGGGVGDGIGGGNGDGSLTGSPNGTMNMAKVADNIGSITGSSRGKIDSSKGSEGLAVRGDYLVAGIPARTVVLGSIDPDGIRKALMAHLDQFRACYQKELDTTEQEDKDQGVVTLDFMINKIGRSSDEEVISDALKSSDVKGCVASVLKTIQFPSPKGGGTVQVKQPINFYARKV
jgi:hypothetical protein